MDLKSAHSQESDFQESGEVDREIGLSGKWSLCYMVRFLAMPRVFVAFDFLCLLQWSKSMTRSHADS